MPDYLRIADELESIKEQIKVLQDALQDEMDKGTNTALAKGMCIGYHQVQALLSIRIQGLTFMAEKWGN